MIRDFLPLALAILILVLGIPLSGSSRTPQSDEGAALLDFRDVIREAQEKVFPAVADASGAYCPDQ